MPIEIADPLELHVAELVNAARAEAGLPPVHVEVHLNSAAQGHSDWMSAEGTLSHDGSGGSALVDRVGDAEFPLAGGSWHLTENVSYAGTNGAPGRDDVDNLHAALMGSPAHQANILDPNVDYLGVGLATGQIETGGGMQDVLFLTQNFASTSQPVLVQEEVDGQPLLTTYLDGEPVEGSSEPVDDGQPDEGQPDEDEDEDDASGEDEDDRPDAGTGSSSGGACFVATAAFGDGMHPDVVMLRRLRDEVLTRSPAGRAFIRLYRIIGPRLARRVHPHGMSGRLSRLALRPAVMLAGRAVHRDKRV